MNDIKDRAREYLAEHSEYSEVFGQTFVAVDTLTAMVEFANQETKELEEKLGDIQMQKAGEKSDLVWKLKTANEQKAEQLTKAKELLQKCLNTYLRDPELRSEVERFLKGIK